MMNRLERALAWMASLALVGCGPDFASPGGAATEDRSAPTFEAFRATVERADNGVYFVEGDEPLANDTELRAYYDREIAPRSGSSDRSEPARTVGNDPGATTATAAQPLLIAQRPFGGDSMWFNSQKRVITYCLGPEFPSLRPALLDALVEAGRAWERVADVRFIHDASQDGSGCTPMNGAVFFDVHVFSTVTFGARAFYPHFGRLTSNLHVNSSTFSSTSATLVSMLTHEFGHILGFHHEHDRIPNANPVCIVADDEPQFFRSLTTIDYNSIMFYSSCPQAGTLADTIVTARDAQGAASVYGASQGVQLVAMRTIGGQFLNAVGGGGAGVSALGAAIDQWETLQLVQLDVAVFALRARSGQFVTVRTDGSLAADASFIGTRERFTLEYRGGGRYSLRGADGRRVQASGGESSVSTHPDNSSPAAIFDLIHLDARRVVLRGWDRFFYGSSRTGSTAVSRVDGVDPRAVLTRVTLPDSTVGFRDRTGRYLTINSSGSVTFSSFALGGAQNFRFVTPPTTGVTTAVQRVGTTTNLRVTSGGVLDASGTNPNQVDNRFTVVDLEGWPVAMRVVGDSQFVKAVGSGGQEVTDDGAAIGAWERLVRIDLGENQVALRAPNGNYFSADLGSDGRIYATSDWILPWERFDISTLGAGSFWLRANNGRFVAAEIGGDRRLIANRTSPGSWETFVFQSL